MKPPYIGRFKPAEFIWLRFDLEQCTDGKRPAGDGRKQLVRFGADLLEKRTAS